VSLRPEIRKRPQIFEKPISSSTLKTANWERLEQGGRIVWNKVSPIKKTTNELVWD
jgi:hypothetical protein